MGLFFKSAFGILVGMALTNTANAGTPIISDGVWRGLLANGVTPTTVILKISNRGTLASRENINPVHGASIWKGQLRPGVIAGSFEVVWVSQPPSVGGFDNGTGKIRPPVIISPTTEICKAMGADNSTLLC